MTRTSPLSLIAAEVGRSAVFGFGASAGRDAWRSTRKTSGGIFFWLAMLAAVTLPLLGGRNLVRGYPTRETWQAVKGYFSGITFILLGVAVAFGLSLIFVALFTDPASRDGETNRAFVLFGSVGLAGFPLLAGLVFGLIQRTSRKRFFAITDRNEAFLNKLEMVETGEKEITHYDCDNNPLRFMELTNEAMVFLVVGKRNQRAYIKLTPEGEMAGYTGIMPLGTAREYKDA